jgi:fumarate hydratase class II
MAEFRIEKDSLGEVRVAADALWGAQTQRSLENFQIGEEKMPREILRAFAVLKKAAAETNAALGVLDAEKTAAIAAVCDGILDGRYDGQFPLAVWQTGSGTQSNMNVNEVIAHAAEVQTAGKVRLHPNDDVNKGQSSNDTFPAALHMAVRQEVERALLPELAALKATFSALSEKYADVIKIGRTHLMDATPLSLGQEISAWAAMLARAEENITALLPSSGICELALGGTAVGTGLNTHPDFGEKVAARISELTGLVFTSAPNKFEALTSRSAVAAVHGALKALAADLLKIANDVRLLASGPRSGIGELILPENEPGSSIMPGKVNPTQCEALSMVCVQVMGNDVAVGVAASQGNFQLNVYLPLLAYNALQSIRLLADGMRSFNENCAKGIRPNEARIEENLNRSLMLVTALTPLIGYDAAAKVALCAHREGITLREAAVKLGYLTAEDYDRLVDPRKMV